MKMQFFSRLLVAFFCVYWIVPPAHAQVLGDINGDSVVNAVDVQIAINSALGIENEHSHAADINGDGQVNAVDVQLVINAALGISIGTPVPDVVGLTQAEAESALTSAGLAVGDITDQHHPDIPEGHVISQNPAAGVEVLPNTVVDLVRSLGPPSTTSDTIVPNVVGMVQSEAAAALVTAGLSLGTTTEVLTDDAPTGVIIGQNPEAGVSVAPGTSVSIILSAGPAPVSVPNVVGMTQSEAEAALDAVDLVIGAIAEAHSNTVAAGLVISQQPVAGSNQLPFSSVNIVLSLGPEPVSVPNVVGMPQADAEEAIVDVGLAVGLISQAYSETIPEGHVVSQVPSSSQTALPGSMVDIVLSLGPETLFDTSNSFFGVPAGGPAPLEVEFIFTNAIEATKVTSWAWDLNGDGSIDSTDPSPAFIYEDPGIYDVTLTVQTNSGDIWSITEEGIVEVREPVETIAKDNVIFINNEPELSFVFLAENLLELEFTGTGDLPIQLGDILIGLEGDGYALEINEIHDFGDMLVLDTTPASLADIFEQGEISTVIRFTEDDLQKAGFEMGPDGKAFLPFMNVELGAGLRVSGRIDWEPQLDFGLGFNPAYLRAVFFSPMTTRISADVTIDGAVSYRHEKPILVNPVKLKQIYGPFLIITEFNIVVGVDAGFDGEARLSSGYVKTANPRVGVELWSDQVNLIGELNTSAWRRIGPEVDMSANAFMKVYVEPRGRVLVYGITGPGVGLQGYVRADAQVTSPEQLTLSAGVDATYRFSLVDLSNYGLNFNVGIDNSLSLAATQLGIFPLVLLPELPPAIPAFTATPVTGRAPLTVNFTNQSDPGAGTITNYRWDMGDGTVRTTQHASHTYTTPGDYLVTLAVTGSTGSADWVASEVIRVLPTTEKPRPSFTASRTKGPAPLTVSFTDTSSPGTAPITQWAWDFDDDGIVDSGEQNPTFVYDTPGIYSVVFAVQSHHGFAGIRHRNLIEVTEPDSPPPPPPGDRFVHVPAGVFQMGRPYSDTGSSVELPVHSVYLDAYNIGKYPITNAEFAEVLNWAHARGYLENSSGGAYTGGIVYAHGQPIADTVTTANWSQIVYADGSFSVRSRAGHGGQQFPMDDHPMVMVSWYGAVAYCNWRSEREGKQPVYNTATWERISPLPNGYRLPTEAEWERAAAWDGSRHWRYGFTSDSISFARANYYDSEYANPLGLTSMPYTSPVGWYNGVNPARLGQSSLTQDSRSPVGAYDMSGNVWEWCHDWYASGQYSTNSGEGIVINPVGAGGGTMRVLRGGAYNYSAGACRSAARSLSGPPANRLTLSGVRVVWTP